MAAGIPITAPIATPAPTEPARVPIRAPAPTQAKRTPARSAPAPRGSREVRSAATLRCILFGVSLPARALLCDAVNPVLMRKVPDFVQLLHRGAARPTPGLAAT